MSTRSELKALVVAGGTLGGDASVVVHELNWQEGGEMVDAGETIIPVGSRMSFLAGSGGGGLLGAKRRLTVRGEFALISGALYLDASSKLKLTKTSRFDINTASPTGQPQGMLKRDSGQPDTERRYGRVVKLGTAGPNPHAYRR